MSNWDIPRIKAHIRLTSQKLAQLQQRHDAAATISQGDIATLLLRGDVRTARLKAERLKNDERLSDVLEQLEMHCGTLLASMSELIQSRPSPGSPLSDAVCAIMYAAPTVNSRELSALRDQLLHILGPKYHQLLFQNPQKLVPSRIYHDLHAPVPSSVDIYGYMSNIAQSHSVNWTPPMLPHQKLTALAELLDPASSQPFRLSELQSLMATGISEQPWLRPRVWKLLLGFVSENRAAWAADAKSRRHDYYDIARRLLPSASSDSLPTSPLSRPDASLISISNALAAVPIALFNGLEEDTESPVPSPLDHEVEDDLRLDAPNALMERLAEVYAFVHRDEESFEPPVIRVEPESPSKESFDATTPPAFRATRIPWAQSIGQRHGSALVRLLYLHISIHPTSSPYLASLLVPLYNCFCQEADTSELAHAEADTFWALGELVAEVADLSDDATSPLWIARLGKRLEQVDSELYADMVRKGLDPALPHFSFRWLAPVLTQTLPISSILTLWDGILSKPPRTADQKPRLEFFVDICTAMLISVRTNLFRCGGASKGVSNLWHEENIVIQPTSSDSNQPTPLGAAFEEGLQLLYHYPIVSLGGSERILETALELPSYQPPPSNTSSLGAGTLKGITNNLWKGLSVTPASPSSSEDEEDDTEEGHETETPKRSALTNFSMRLRDTVVRGISNQSAMETPPSPSSPLPPTGFTSPVSVSGAVPADEQVVQKSNPEPQGTSSLWSYAEGLSNSDTAAKLSKLSTNWRVKALSAWKPRENKVSEPNPKSDTPNPRMDERGPPQVSPKMSETTKGQFMDVKRPDSLPPKPLFRNPRESFSPHSRHQAYFSVPHSPPSSSSPLHDDAWSESQRNRGIAAALASLTGATNDKPKSGPKPLLLSASNLMTPNSPPLITRSATSTPTPHQGQWSDVYRQSTVTPRRSRDSQSSVSSVSSPRPGSRPGSGWDSEDSSRNFPSSRHHTRSPMAPSIRYRNQVTDLRNPRDSSDSDHASEISRARVNGSRNRGWSHVTIPDSPQPSPPLKTPSNSLTQNVDVRPPEEHRGSLVLSIDPDSRPDTTPQLTRGVLKNSSEVMSPQSIVDASTLHTPTSATATEPKSPRVRTKRYNTHKPTHLHIVGSEDNSLVVPQTDSNATTPRAFDFIGRRNSRSKSPRSPRPSKAHESGAEEGDDEESYEEILSGYEDDDTSSMSWNVVRQ
ncbi:hypothetical protein SISSUDRAFT_1039304 [Sistotremastrum suecicum HHB10207 ss-3]|uniref:Rab-GAP TBC domain-containing protein n=1 Tax=Sistotremastrum suecicum HHB10207 ss-3 TaxID=1314776 RepID=A0A166ISU8_9AGAM|nr:hypothetical protein SISSUDRAFT_1039304 [Sistotremastrum suecicum HHB10207 ss-3]